MLFAILKFRMNIKQLATVQMRAGKTIKHLEPRSHEERTWLHFKDVKGVITSCEPRALEEISI